MTDRVYGGVVRLALGLFRGLNLTFDVMGGENVPRSGGAVIVINHVGYLDFALAGVPFWREQRRLVRFMAKQEVFDHKVSGPLMRAMQHIPVDRTAGAASFRHAIEALKNDQLVGVFPEATISRSFCLKEFKSGAPRMARAAKVPMIPMTLYGSQRLWTKDHKPATTLRRGRGSTIGITIGEPIDPAPGDQTPLLVETMDRLLNETRARYPDPPGDDPWWVPAHLGGTAPTPERAAELEAEEMARRAAKRNVGG